MKIAASFLDLLSMRFEIELSLPFCQVDGEKGYSSFFVIARLSYKVFSPSSSSYLVTNIDDGRHAVTASTSLPWFVLSKMNKKFYSLTKAWQMEAAFGVSHPS